MEPKAESCGLIIFGASGDLTHRKLIPSLLKLAQDNVLPASFYLVGVGRTPLTDVAFQAGLREALPGEKLGDLEEALIQRCVYVAGDYNKPALYKSLQKRLNELDQSQGIPGRRIFYLSTPPALYECIAHQLGAAGLATSHEKTGWVRIVVEKPFGRDAVSAAALNRTLHQIFQENQIYRIDHYLGKETVQNILMFRFANAIYEPIWNRKYIEHIQITAAESVGVEHRAGYYEQAGALRDMFQNHLLQLLSLVAMEPPSCLEADALRDEKVKIIAALVPPSPAELDAVAVRGQYQAGEIHERPVPAYRQEEGVNPKSTVETYAALRVGIDNWRWQGVPIYLRSGKVLARRLTEIKVQFKHVPTSIFKPLMADQLSTNILTFRIQPDEAISLSFEAKHPGPKLCLSTVTMQFNYQDAFGTPPPEAYTRLLLDVMLGDQTLFARQDWVSSSWEFLSPFLERWAEQKEKGLVFYPAGSWGPPEANALLEKDGRQWI